MSAAAPLAPWAAALAATLSAMVAGALLVALLVLLPLLMAEPDERYPRTNTFVLRRMDRAMPLIAGLAVAATGLALAGAAAAGASAVAALHLVAGLGLTGLVVVSAVVLRRVNLAIAGAAGTAELAGLRRTWRGWHLTRVAAAFTGGLANAAALVITVT